MLTLFYSSMASGDYTAVFNTTQTPVYAHFVGMLWNTFSYMILVKVLIAVMQACPRPLRASPCCPVWS